GALNGCGATRPRLCSVCEGCTGAGCVGAAAGSARSPGDGRRAAEVAGEARSPLVARCRAGSSRPRPAVSSLAVVKTNKWQGILPHGRRGAKIALARLEHARLDRKSVV